MKITQLSVEEKQTLKETFSKQATEHYPYVACFIYDYFHYKV